MSYDLADSLFSAPTPLNRQDPVQGLRQRLPLNIIWSVLFYFDDADLATLCRVSRLLNYMATNLLYRRIYLTLESGRETLDSFQPDDAGYNHGSSFAMGLLALATKKSANLVEYLHLDGQWPTPAPEDTFATRKYLDECVMLNIAVRTALQACQNLEELKWTLDGVKLMSTCYTAIAELPKLSAIYIKFTDSPIPQPRVTMPAMPQLKSLTFENFDPNHNPANLAEIIYSASGLECLNMGFSPRLMEEQESVPLLDLFHLNVEHSRKLRLKNFGLYHLFANSNPEVNPILDPVGLESLTVINSFGPAYGNTKQSQVYGLFDQSWYLQNGKPFELNKIKIIRTDRVNSASIKDLATLTGLEEVYLVQPWKKPKKEPRTRSTTTTPSTIDGTPFVPGPPLPNKGSMVNAPYVPTAAQILRDSLIDTISEVVGTRLRKLILSSRFPVRLQNMSRLLASCPNIEQIAFAQELLSPAAIRQMAPTSTKLKCFRMLRPEHPGSEGKEARKDWDEFEPRNDHGYYLELELTGAFGMNPLDGVNIKWIGVGDRCYEAGTLYQEQRIVHDEYGDEIESKTFRRSVKEVPMSAVAHLDLWKYDITSNIV